MNVSVTGYRNWLRIDFEELLEIAEDAYQRAQRTRKPISPKEKEDAEGSVLAKLVSGLTSDLLEDSKKEAPPFEPPKMLERRLLPFPRSPMIPMSLTTGDLS
jgi:hypothetical protein